MGTKADIQHDISIIYRDYSRLRKINKKWMIENNQSDQEMVPLRSIIFRSSLKRSPMLLREFLYFWQHINPLDLRGISAALYTSVNTCLYSELEEDECKRTEFVKKDLKSDFQGHLSLTFCETYDSFFELLDSYTKTKLLCEYIRTLQSFTDKIKKQKLLRFFNVWSKKHLQEEKRNLYHKWMLNIFKEKNAVRENKQLTKTVKQFKPPDLMERPRKSMYTEGDVTPKKIKKMISHSQRTIKTHQSSRPTRILKVKSKVPRKIEKIERKKKNGKFGWKLEEIIKHRKLSKENNLDGNLL